MQRVGIGNRRNLSVEVEDQLRREVLAGQLEPGSRLNEVGLSERLGVSRTPIREALSQLVGEGLVRQLPRRGFFVTELSVDEVSEIYPIRRLLDPEALRLSGLPSERDIARLRSLNERLRAEPRGEQRVALDDRWHLALVARCPSRTLLALIRQFIDRTRRYEMAYMGSGQGAVTAVEEHEAILDALEQGDLEAACDGLRQNMTSAVEPLVEWLSANPDPPEKA